MVKKRFTEQPAAMRSVGNKGINRSQLDALTTNVKLKTVQRFISNAGIRNVEKINVVFGGLVHHVFQIITKDNEYYLKIRDDHFVHMPAVASNPQEIRQETNALRIASHLLPDTFPHVVAADYKKGMLLITSIMERKDTLLDRLERSAVTCDDMAIIGKNLKEIHDTLATVKEAIRDDDEREYQNNLLRRLGSQDNKALDEVIQKLSSLPRTLIFGDLSPKNLGLVNGALRICDLEGVHRGNVIFDVGFFIGHIYVHSLDEEYQAAKLVRTFLKAYQSSGRLTGGQESLLLQHIALGVVLYRLNNPRVPYAINITNEERSNIVHETKKLLTWDMVDWTSIEKRLQCSKVALINRGRLLRGR